MGSTEAKQPTINMTVLGATGSIGGNTLDLLAREAERFTVYAVTANTNVEKLAQIAISAKAKKAVIGDHRLYVRLKELLAGANIEALAGSDALCQVARDDVVDYVMAGIVGAAGLAPTWAAVEAGKTIGLANKECLVCAGQLFMQEAKRCEARLLPVDSEHNAIFQLIENRPRIDIDKVILTASGGAFLNSTFEDMKSAGPEDALKHPNWSMGAKITIDSATMMNKGFELIEAHHLFDLDMSDLDVLVHPQSIIHGLVQLKDGSLIAHMTPPDMRSSINYCLNWPQRQDVDIPKLDLAEVATLTFETPDPDKYPALGLCRQAKSEGDGMTNALNAANEVAVHAFLNRQIEYLDIIPLCERILEKAVSEQLVRNPENINEVFSMDKGIRELSISFLP